MTAEARRVNRPRGEVHPDTLERIMQRVQAVEDAQRALEAEVTGALAGGASINEMARQTGIAKTTLLRWSKR